MTAAFRAQSNDDSNIETQSSNQTLDIRRDSANDRDPTHFKSV